MHILLTGGTGYIGAHIASMFLDRKHNVVCFGPIVEDNKLLERIGKNHLIEGDILNKLQLNEAIDYLKPDAIIHLAAYGAGTEGLLKSASVYPDKAMDVNLHGFYNVLSASVEFKVPRVIWSSSSTVYGKADWYNTQRVDERADAKPVTFYGLTKAMSENMAAYFIRNNSSNITGVRLPLIFGPDKWYKGAGNSLVDIFENCKYGIETVIKEFDEPFDLMYIKDVAELFYKLTTMKGKGSALYNVRSFTVTYAEIVETVKNFLPGHKLEYQVVTRSDTVVYPLMDTSSIEKDLSYAPVFTLTEACRDYIEALV